jgi:DNA-directed RNA polymerase specialized sigma24 family protein
MLLVDAHSIPPMGSGRFIAWLDRVAKNAAIDRLRHHGRMDAAVDSLRNRNRYPARHNGMPLWQFQGQDNICYISENNDENHLIRQVLPDLLREAKEAMQKTNSAAVVAQVEEASNTTHWQAFFLAKIFHLPASDIASFLGVNRSVVYQGVHRVGSVLKQIIADRSARD